MHRSYPYQPGAVVQYGLHTSDCFVDEFLMVVLQNSVGDGEALRMGDSVELVLRSSSSLLVTSSKVFFSWWTAEYGFGYSREYSHCVEVDSRGELKNKLNKVGVGANELYLGWSTLSVVKSSGGRRVFESNLQRLCRRAGDTGIKLLGGDLERSPDSAWGRLGVAKDSGIIPGQHRLSVNWSKQRLLSQLEVQNDSTHRIETNLDLRTVTDPHSLDSTS